MSNGTTTTTTATPTTPTKPKTEPKAGATKGASTREQGDDPYLDKVQANDQHDHVTNDYRPSRQEVRRFMMTHSDPDYPPNLPVPPEVVEPPPEAKK